MLTKRQILSRIRKLKKDNMPYCVAIKVVVNEALDGKNPDAQEIRIVPIIIDSDTQYDYTMRYCMVMIEKDGQELVFGSNDKLQYIDIIGAMTEEEGNIKMRKIISDYAKHHGYGKLMNEEQLTDIAKDSVIEYAETLTEQNKEQEKE